MIDLTEIKISAQNFNLRSMNESAGVGIDGLEQIRARPLARVWTCKLQYAASFGSDARKLYALADDAHGRAGIILVSICNSGALTITGDQTQFYKDIGFTDAEIAAGGVTFSDGQTFSDGSQFALPAFTEPVVRNDTPKKATQIKLDGAIAERLECGHMFVYKYKAYRVASNTNGLIRFNPELRHSISAGEKVEVSNPVVKMRLQSDDGFKPFLEAGLVSRGETLDLVEHFDRVGALA